MSLTVGPPRIGCGCPPFYFGGLSQAAREVAAQAADVYLMWPDTLDGVASVIGDMRERAARHGRSLKFGYRVHVIVRETEAEARAAARRLLSRLDPAEGEAIRDAFILSGYPHQAEADLFARHVLSRMEHGPLFPG